MVCKLNLFWTCKETLAILILEHTSSFYIRESSKSTISYFYFTFVLLAYTFNKPGL